MPILVRLQARGQGMAEYSILLAFIVVSCSLAVTAYAGRVSAFMQNINLGS